MGVQLAGVLAKNLVLGSIHFPINTMNLRVRAEQLHTRMQEYPSLVLSQMVLQPLFVWLIWDQADHQSLLIWLALFYGLHTVELTKWSVHRHRLNTVDECTDWHVHFCFYSAMAGLMWGAVAIFFFPPYLDYQGLVICIMLGLVAGAVTMNPVHPPTLVLYVAGIMLPLSVRLVAENDTPHWVIFLMLLLFGGIVMVAGRELNRTFMVSLKQRFDNLELIEELSKKTAALEESRYQLQLANGILQQSELLLEQQVNERTAQLLQRTGEINAIKDTTIIALTSLAEARDNETGNHIRRTQNYMKALALHLRGHPRFRDFLSDENIELLYKLAPLHDIGKVGIPDHILLKPGKLTAEEFEIMKTHAALGGNAIAQAEDRLGFTSQFLHIARQIVIGHHEKWDGSGYPFALRGDNIPIPARLMAVADVYDALTCKRVYKPAMSHDVAAAIIMEGKGKHFDPDIADAFFSIQTEFIAIAEKYRD